MHRLKTPLLKPPIIFDGELGKVRQWAWVTLHLSFFVFPLCGTLSNRPMKGNSDFTIREIFLVESGILGFGIRITAQGIRT